MPDTDRHQTATGAIRAHAVMALGFSLMVNILFFASPLYMMQLYGRVLDSRSLETLASLSAVLLLVLIAMAAADAARGRLLARAAARLDRHTRPASLTEPGELLARAVRDGLGQIAGAIEDIRALAGQEGQQVTVACTIGMATHWLMPRLPGFYALHPEITVNVQAPSTDLPELAPGIDLAIRYGTGGWREGVTVKLFDESVCPVGAPALVERLLAGGTGLDRAPLIHVRSPFNRHWAGWEDYLKLAAVARPRLGGQSFNNYVQAGQAALDGRGLMLGWRSISERNVADGVLREWPGGRLDLGTAYFATSARKMPQAAALFLGWLTAAGTSGAPAMGAGT
ncbi:LysR substrate-binding domain-containing protein [Mangrovicoccus ximenensis]|uniref:LysR substrate-binding domain-containing protein n=1 Tax=Mangrovicoccus ximenensis TaxID=1911570 RepID=UPI001F3E0D45|nr:LysR substrate-binding domain-containing protein [Mangrovicoccus ximenensis]